MAEEKRDPPSPAGTAQDAAAAAKRRRPAPTIDLKATEIASAPVTPEQPPDSTDGLPGSAASAEAAASSSASAAGDKSAASGETGSRQDSAWWQPHWLRARQTVSGLHGRAVDRLGFRTLAAAGLSAAATLCVVLALWLLAGPSPGDERADALAARMTVLELKLSDLAKAPPKTAGDPGVPVDLAARLAKAEQAIGALANLESRVAKVEQSAGAIAALDARVASLEKAPPQPAAAAADNQGLVDRIAALEAALRDARSRADAALDAAQTNVAPAATPATDHRELEALAARLAALEQAIKGADERIARAAASGADKDARLAFAALALRTAVERGDPFVNELAAVKPLGEAAQIGALEPFAASGVPRAATLARDLAQLAPAMLNAAGATAREGGIMDRLQQGAERLVRIRPINEVPGDDPAAAIARAEVKAANGELGGALTDLSRLPEAVRAPAADWIKKAEAQRAALAAARRLADSAVGALAKP